MNLDYLSEKITNLRIRQLLYPSASEKRFLTQEGLARVFHLPVPSSFGLRFYPLSLDLSEQLYRQIGDFDPFNLLCIQFQQCCRSYYLDNRGSFSWDCVDLLDEWGAALRRGEYYSTSTYFGRFADRCALPICFNGAQFLPLRTSLDLVPLSLFCTWQISFFLDQSNAVDCLYRLSVSHFFQDCLIEYVEIIEPRSGLPAGYEKLTIYLNSKLEIGDVELFLDEFFGILACDEFCAPLVSHVFGHLVRPYVSLQRGFVGLKLLLRLLGLLNSYYDPEFAFAYPRHDASACGELL
jgi:hypothetical protein